MFNVLAGLCLVCVTAYGFKHNLPYAKLPNVNLLLSLTDFEKYIVNKQVGELYYVLPVPPLYEPYINYYSTITKISGTPNYTLSFFGETPGINSECVKGTALLSPKEKDKTLFYLNSKTLVHAMWSSMPWKYIWKMRCSNYHQGKRKCPLSESDFGILTGKCGHLKYVILGHERENNTAAAKKVKPTQREKSKIALSGNTLYIHGAQDDIPFALVVEDLCKATGLKFGADNLKWFFNFGKNTLCV